ncbi:MAG: bifunctional oligoribonuclease/PAP phosphatase NrnA [Zetaproteobacteria bacterium]|nr:bifunctional oligoribonuclease/PAP phosphatase NrnA [Zetaproteobacteria bacterium]
MKFLYEDVNWQTVKDALCVANKIHVIAHVSPDSDTIGSQIALYHAFTSKGFDVVMHNIDPVPRICRYLQGSELITHGEDFSALDGCDTIVAVDAGAFSRLGMLSSYVEGKTLINIDHHASNTLYGDINVVDARYCATGAMVYDLIQSYDLSFNEAMASPIYAAVLTDTASFRLSTVTADTHRMVANLLEAGASTEQASREIYQNFPKQRFDLLKYALDSLDVKHHGCSAWISVPYVMYEKTGMGAEDSEGFIDYARSIAGVCVAVFLREESPNIWKLSLRGQYPYDVGALAASLGGGGHKYASGCSLNGSLEQVSTQVFDAVSVCLQT